MSEDVNPASHKPAIPYESAPIFREEHAEGRITRVVEQQAAKLPSGAFLLGSLGAMAVSFLCEVAGRRRASRFIGLWPGPLLSMGIYVKLVRVLGVR
jgi:hypothetical protein